MAVHSAHLTSLNLIKPSLFDFIAQEALSDLLNPAGRKIIESLYLKYPQLQSVLRYYDEGYLCFSALLNFYYLKNYGGSFSESLYGLRRVGVSEKSLSTKEIALSLAALTVVPYVFHKLQSKSERLYFDQNRNTKCDTFVQLNSAIQTCYQLARWVQHLRYVSGETEYNSPLLLLTGLRLRIDDPTSQQQSSRNWVTMFIQRGFELGAFFLQCYQSWQSDGRRAFSILQDIPPPPKIEYNGQLGDNLCQICRGQRQQTTALAVSGYVFCFVCIQHYVSRHHRCPITGFPASFNDLIRLYPNASS